MPKKKSIVSFEKIEQHLADHDEQIIELVKAIKQLLKPDPSPKKRRIGY